MIDQNNPTIPSETVQPEAAANVEPTSSVVVPTSGAVVPKWFYFIFGATVIAFFVVTTLLIAHLTQRSPSSVEVVPTITPKITSPSPTPQASDSAVSKLNQLGSSDEVAAIEFDLKNTDLGPLDQAVNVVDSQMNSSL